MSIIVQTRICACGMAFKVPSTTDSTECWPCRARTLAREEAEHAAKVDAMPLPAWADVDDPFLNRWGARLDTTHTGNQPMRAVKP